MKPGIYLHHKGKKYEVLGTARHSESSEEFVVYKRTDDPDLWVRPKQMFLELVEKDGKMVPRFKYIG